MKLLIEVELSDECRRALNYHSGGDGVRKASRKECFSLCRDLISAALDKIIREWRDDRDAE